MPPGDNAFLASIADELALFEARQQAAFVAEVARWDNEVDSATSEDAPIAVLDDDDAQHVTAEISWNVWKIMVAEVTVVAAGETLLVLEAMKMEFAVTAPMAGKVKAIRCRAGRPVEAGALLVTIDAVKAV